MDLSKEICEEEIVACEAAIEAHERGMLVHKLVLKHFKEELKKFPKKENA